MRVPSRRAARLVARTAVRGLGSGLLRGGVVGVVCGLALWMLDQHGDAWSWADVGPWCWTGLLIGVGIGAPLGLVVGVIGGSVLLVVEKPRLATAVTLGVEAFVVAVVAFALTGGFIVAIPLMLLVPAVSWPPLATVLSRVWRDARSVPSQEG